MILCFRVRRKQVSANELLTCFLFELICSFVYFL